jgi:DNA polymerase IV
MEIPLNPNPPETMHIDLNACFAMTEQQANPLLRGRPVGVTNRAGSNWGTIIAPSYEAKQLGVRCGTSVAEARQLAPGIAIIETDPAKYRYVHGVLKSIFHEAAPRVTMKSIDEGVLDFKGTAGVRQGRSLEDIGYQIKARVKEALGEWMTVNVGIAPNWFLAKLAASLNKPDGLDVIDHHNLEGVYSYSKLTDLNGINRRLRARLMAHGIINPYEFLHTPQQVLTKQVFKSINGRHWYYRLRGYEVDDITFGMRQVGKQYVLHHRTADPEELGQVLYKLCYYISRRLRKYDLAAYGMHLDISYVTPRDRSLEYTETPRWFLRHRFKHPVSSLRDLYERTMWLFNQSPAGHTVLSFSLSSYGLEARRHEQLMLYETAAARSERVDHALQAVNDRYGDLTLIPARLLGTEAYVADKIAFGSTRYLLSNDPS